MEDTVIDIIQTIGLPIGLIIYYLFFERPRQEARDDKTSDRYDSLVEKLLNGQRECAEKMENALEEHNEYIKRLIKIFESKSKI